MTRAPRGRHESRATAGTTSVVAVRQPMSCPQRVMADSVPRLGRKTTLTPSSLPTEVGQLLGAEAPRSHPRCLRAVKLFGPNTPSAPEGECTRTAAALLRDRRAKPSPDAPSHCQPLTLAVPIPQDRCNRGRPSAVDIAAVRRWALRCQQLVLAWQRALCTYGKSRSTTFCQSPGLSRAFPRNPQPSHRVCNRFAHSTGHHRRLGEPLPAQLMGRAGSRTGRSRACD